MPDDSKLWFNIATEDLEVAQILFESKKYRYAVFHLQQAGEKTSKGLLMKIGFIPEDKEPERMREARKVFGVYTTKPKDYGHEWHMKMLSVLDNMMDSLDFLAKFMSSIEIPDKKFEFDILEFRKKIPDFKKMLSTARKVKLNPNPSIVELDDVIRICNQLLDTTPYQYQLFLALPQLSARRRKQKIVVLLLDCSIIR